MKVPGCIGAEEDLGRRVYSETSAKRARRSRVPHREFLARRGDTSISVDRLTAMALDEVAALAHEASASRDGAFRGWASVAYEQASRNGRQVVASPDGRNPSHGEIVLPESAALDRDEQVRHAQELADASRWREDPTL